MIYNNAMTQDNRDIFFQSIQQTFPSLDEQLQEEIYQKVSLHMLEFLTAKIYENDNYEQQTLTNFDREKYTEQIVAKFISLPKDEQTTIKKQLAIELTRVMHALYKAYE
jgi:hypothetical protein